MKTIEVNLDDHLEEFVQKMIATGEYTDNSDVVCEALTMLEEEEKLSDAPLALTPKACLEIAITDTGISDVDIFVEDVNNRRFCSAFTILEHRMKNEGYITDENGDTHSTSESKKPFDIFTKTIRGFYPNTRQTISWRLPGICSFITWNDRETLLKKNSMLMVRLIANESNNNTKE